MEDLADEYFKIKTQIQDLSPGHVSIHPGEKPEVEYVELVSHSKKSVILAPVANDQVTSGEVRFERSIKETFFKNESEVKIVPVTDTTEWEADLVEVYIKVNIGTITLDENFFGRKNKTRHKHSS